MVGAGSRLFHGVFESSRVVGQASCFRSAEGEVRHALKTLEKRYGHGRHRNLNGLVLDLRKNPGGDEAEGVGVANIFIKSGVLNTDVDRNGQRVDVQMANPKRANYARLPLSVLVDEYTASSAEIVAGAVKNHHRGMIVGSQTYGKGVAQPSVQFPDGSVLKFTAFGLQQPDPQNPNVPGKSIHKIGVTPDVTTVAARQDLMASGLRPGFPDHALAWTLHRMRRPLAPGAPGGVHP